jgi:hypothetical protein
MKVFHCDHCEALVFFENHQCGQCGNTLAYLPDAGTMACLVQKEDGLWATRKSEQAKYRLCANYPNVNICNWALPANDPNKFCRSCRLTRVIPDLSVPGNEKAWYKFEVAKRRLIYSLISLQLPLRTKSEDPQSGLAFEFLADVGEKVKTGHQNGVITLALAEANDAERERRRVQLYEPVRTVLGHFRHESGHYYWDRLIDQTYKIDRFRQLFGDERLDYGQALQNHYNQGPPANWQDRFVSAYASSHPWEDWAETWSHYLSMLDTLETASACGMSLKPQRKDEPRMQRASSQVGSFDALIENWFPLTYALNNLSRGLGQQDAYPFVLSAPAIEKLRCVHEIICDVR